MNSSALAVPSDGSPRVDLSAADSARSKRPLDAITTRSVRSRRTGLAGRWKLPQAQLPAAPSALRQMTSPRSNSPWSSCRIPITSDESERYGFRPRLATLTAMRPPGSSLRLHSAKTPRSICK